MVDGALPEVAVAVRTLIALVFLWAAYGKLRHWTEFEGVIANYRLLPDFWVVPVAYALPPVEALLGAGLLLGLGHAWAEAGAAVLLLAFAAAMGINVVRGRRHIDCGCFQSSLKQTLNWILVMRNVVMAMLLGVAVLSSGAADAGAMLDGVLVGGVLFVILQSLNILWSIVPAWRGTNHGFGGRS